MNTDWRAEIEWFLFKCFVGAFPFLGWFILYYFGEMVLAWLPIAVSKPEYALPAAQILQVLAERQHTAVILAEADGGHRPPLQCGKPPL
jgi:hypothetical protein